MVTRQYALWLNRENGPLVCGATNSPDYFDNEEFPVYASPRFPHQHASAYRLAWHLRRGQGAAPARRHRQETLSTNIFRISFDP
jgi:SPX domain protein involved in polyphosphate accumulation